MKKIIGLSSIFVLILFAIIINIYNLKKEEKIIRIDGNKYALTIDGEGVESIPEDGFYYLSNYSCENDSSITWDAFNHDLYIDGDSIKVDNCTLNFSEGYPPLNTMKVGDYVAYVGDNGCSDGEIGVTGGEDAEAGNSCLGENANQSTDTSGGYTYGFCGENDFKFYTYGWRIAYIENDNVYLVSAGAPGCITGEIRNDALIDKLNEAALDYCNKKYVDGGVCPTTASENSVVRAIGNTDFEKITNAISGTASSLTIVYNNSTFCDRQYSYKRCGYNNDLLDNGGNYWFAAKSDNDFPSNSGVHWNPNSRVIASLDDLDSYSYGLRPIIKLSSSVYVTGGNGTMKDPYTIGI